MGDTSIPVLLAIGGATSKEIKNAINLLNLNKKQITLMHGYQDGPTKIIDTHFCGFDKSTGYKWGGAILTSGITCVLLVSL